MKMFMIGLIIIVVLLFIFSAIMIFDESIKK